MTFKITFRVEQPGQLLPLSYQYELSCWLYNLMGHSKSGFSDFLHDRGYVNAGKRFKFFTFSNLYVPKYQILDDRMRIDCPEVYLQVSFLVDQAGHELLLGLFDRQRLRLGDTISKVDLRVERTRMFPTKAVTQSTVLLRTLSPIMVSKPEKQENGKLTHQYLHPSDSDYSTYFFGNLQSKLEAALSHGLVATVEEETNTPRQLRLVGAAPRKQGVRIKAFTPQETKVIGYKYDFELTADPRLINLGLQVGFGGENALGFGATRVL